jgi:diguanylate cyclase (GGDEF)-like protein
MEYNQLKFARKFMIGATVIITLVICGLFLAFNMRAEELTISMIHQQAKSLFKQVILIRRWVTGYGGVYVEVRPGVNPNPFLTSLPGLKVNIFDKENNKHYTLRNPGLVTSEMSQLSSEAEGYFFHVSSLKPVNSQTNSPDDFERASLLKFEKGTLETYGIEQRQNGPVYRYMAPLVYETPCNGCHSNQGYKLGDIRGGISISIPMHEVVAKMRVNRLLTAAFALSVLGLLFGALAYINNRFMKTLNQAQDKLVKMATVDGLTGLLNRQAGLERVDEELSRNRRSGQPLACLLMDIDRFKKINDTYGHQAGDEVLASFGATLRRHTRKHDIVCRYGGEEFLLLLAGTSLAAARTTAEKIREVTSSTAVSFNDCQISFTTSIGLALLQPEETAESLIARADTALYQAKNTGRNQVTCAENGSTHDN